MARAMGAPSAASRPTVPRHRALIAVVTLAALLCGRTAAQNADDGGPPAGGWPDPSGGSSAGASSGAAPCPGVSANQCSHLSSIVQDLIPGKSTGEVLATDGVGASKAVRLPFGLDAAGLASAALWSEATPEAVGTSPAPTSSYCEDLVPWLQPESSYCWSDPNVQVALNGFWGETSFKQGVDDSLRMCLAAQPETNSVAIGFGDDSPIKVKFGLTTLALNKAAVSLDGCLSVDPPEQLWDGIDGDEPAAVEPFRYHGGLQVDATIAGIKVRKNIKVGFELTGSLLVDLDYDRDGTLLSMSSVMDVLLGKTVPANALDFAVLVTGVAIPEIELTKRGSDGKEEFKLTLPEIARMNVQALVIVSDEGRQSTLGLDSGVYLSFRLQINSLEEIITEKVVSLKKILNTACDFLQTRFLCDTQDNPVEVEIFAFASAGNSFGVMLYDFVGHTVSFSVTRYDGIRLCLDKTCFSGCSADAHCNKGQYCSRDFACKALLRTGQTCHDLTPRSCEYGICNYNVWVARLPQTRKISFVNDNGYCGECPTKSPVSLIVKAAAGNDHQWCPPGSECNAGTGLCEGALRASRAAMVYENYTSPWAKQSADEDIGAAGTFDLKATALLQAASASFVFVASLFLL